MNKKVIKFLQTLRDDCKKSRQDKIMFAYGRAMKSVKACPYEITCEEDAKKLHYIGPKIAKQIGGFLTRLNSNTEAKENSSMKKKKKKKKPAKKKRKKRKYRPQFRSAPWAIMVVLYLKGYKKGERILSKSEICEMCGEYTDTEMVPQAYDDYYSGWSSMNKTLVKKHLVEKEYDRSEKKRGFVLSKLGRNMARLLVKGLNGVENSDISVSEDEKIVSSSEALSDTSDDDEETPKKKKKKKKTKKKPPPKPKKKKKKAKKKSPKRKVKAKVKVKPTPKVFDISSDSDDDTRKKKKKKKKKKKSFEEEYNFESGSTEVVTQEEDKDNRKRKREVERSDIYGVSPPAIKKRKIKIKSRNQLLMVSYINQKKELVQTKDEAEVDIDLVFGLCFKIKMIFNSPFLSTDFLPSFLKRVTLENSKEIICWITDEKSSESSIGLKFFLGNEIFPESQEVEEEKIYEKKKKMRRSNANELFKNSSFEDEKNDPIGMYSLDNVYNRANEDNIFEDILGDKEEEDKEDDDDEEEEEEREIIVPRIREEDVIDYFEYAKKPDGGIDLEIDRIPNEVIDIEDLEEEEKRNFDVILIVDHREKISRSKEYMREQCVKKGIKSEICQLGVGDMCWIVREQGTPSTDSGGNVTGYMLNIVVERKKMDDLAASIMDGRLKEQGFRLNNCGMEKVYYLFEGDERKQKSLPHSALRKAMVQTFMKNRKFRIMRTKNVDHSIDYLVGMTKVIEEKVKKNGIKKYLLNSSYVTLHEFKFNTRKNKNLSATEIFGRQLFSLRGCSKEMAEAIIEEYPVPSNLVSKYNSMKSESAKERLLKDIEVYTNFENISKRTIGPALSKLIYNTFND